jgi:hypothetical protein
MEYIPYVVMPTFKEGYIPTKYLIKDQVAPEPVLPKRGSKAGAGAWERIFQKMVGSEASPECLYIYIYIYIYIYSKENM